MKKIAHLSTIATVTLLTTSLLLTACSTNKTAPNNSTSEQTSQTTSSSSEKMEKPTPQDDKKAYASVFQDYQNIIQYSATYQNNLSHIGELMNKLSVELNSWVVESALYNPSYLRYTFVDVNKDGKNELLVGSTSDNQQIFPIALYYLNKNTPALLAEGFVAGNGGGRNAFTIYQNGDVVTASWGSGTGEGTATFYQFPTDGSQPKQTNQQDFQIGQDKLDQLFGKSKAEELDLTSLNWETFEAPLTAPSATDTTAKDMDINAIASGDYSSLVGTWKNGKGSTLTITADGTVTYAAYPDEPRYLNLDYAKMENGQLWAGIKNPRVMASSVVPTIFIPKGVAITLIADKAEDSTDKTKDRFFSTQYAMPADVLAQEVYYRVE